MTHKVLPRHLTLEDRGSLVDSLLAAERVEYDTQVDDASTHLLRQFVDRYSAMWACGVYNHVDGRSAGLRRSGAEPGHVIGRLLK